MSEPPKKAGGPPSADSDETERLYQDTINLVSALMSHRYGMSEAEVEAAVIVAFRNYGYSSTEIQNPRGYLLLAALTEAATQLRLRGHDVALDADREARDAGDVLFARAALKALNDVQHEAIRLRIFENRSDAEVAAKMGITTQYAKKLVEKSMARLADWHRQHEENE